MRIFASVSPGEMRVAAWDTTLHDYALHRPGAPDGVGDLHLGRVTAKVPAMAGAFVALDGAEGFLPDSARPKGHAVSEGMILAVRITRAGQGGKGPRLTARLEDDEQDAAAAGGREIGLIRRGPDGLARMMALYPDAPVTLDDAATAASLAGHPSRVVRLVPRAFDDTIEQAVAALAEQSHDLPGGARMHVHPTPALVAIDVDLGAASAERQGKAAAQMAGNRALIPALARQIRLRNLSGAILVDLAGMPARRRAGLAPEFAASLAADPLAPRFLGFTALGLAEILRSRVHPPLHELLSGPHAAGLAALRALAWEIAATPARPPLLVASPAIVRALRCDASALDGLANRAGRPLMLQDDITLPSSGWRI